MNELQQSEKRELYVFSDASKEAIGTVAYIKLYDINQASKVGFVIGKSKVAPLHGHPIPRLELCAAVLATELATFIKTHLSIPLDSVSFYTDSHVVLGYINNETRRFHVYVGKCVDRIRRSSLKTQWYYVPTNLNPADLATRPASTQKLKTSAWLRGPFEFLKQNVNKPEQYELIEPIKDKEVRPQVNHQDPPSAEIGI